MGGRKERLPPCIPIAAAFFGALAAHRRRPVSMTSETSNFNEERQVDVTVGTIKRLLSLGYDRYGEAAKFNHQYGIAYNEGYICALRHVLEAENE